ncbi:hypothetical protein ABPG74_009409 [Tetrahymena malaccensis]
MKKIGQFIKKIFIKQQNYQTDDKEESDVYLPSTTEIKNFCNKNFQINWLSIYFFDILSMLSNYIENVSTYYLIQIKHTITQNNIDEQWNSMFYFFAAKLFEIMCRTIYRYVVQNNYIDKGLRRHIKQKTVQQALSLDIHFFEENKSTELVKTIDQGVLFLISYIQVYSEQIRYNLNLFKSGDLYFQNRMSLLLKKNSQLQTFQEFQISDLISNIVTIKQFGTEQKEIQNMAKIQEKNTHITTSRTNLHQSQQIYSHSKDMMLYLFTILQLYIITKSSKNSNLEILFAFSQIQVFYGYIQELYSFIKRNFEKNDNVIFTENIMQIGKLMKLFEQKSQISQQTTKLDYQFNFNSSISFKNVNFSYPKANDKLAKMNQQFYEQNVSTISQTINLHNSGQENSAKILNITNNETKNFLESQQDSNNRIQNTLENISFEIQKGQYVSFVGKSGSGKSTIAKLLLRLYDPNSGSVLFDNENVENIPIKQIKQSIGYVSQDLTLLDSDILQNITYGCDEYNQEDLLQVCNYSGVSEFVFDQKRFPEGLKTLVGANGSKLSGGQKQRIAIARALLKKPSILILDEATSSLDAESEYTVQKYINQLVQSKNQSMTIIVIAHRLSTVVNSDKIFVMEKGQLVEEGTHEELIQKQNVYQKLVFHQISNPFEQ